MEEHELIGLVETWEEEGRSISERYLRDYEVKTKFAKREKKKGRERGGLLLAVRKGTRAKIEWEEEGNEET